MEFKLNMILKVNLMRDIKSLNNRLKMKEKNQEEEVIGKMLMMKIQPILEILTAKNLKMIKLIMLIDLILSLELKMMMIVREKQVDKKEEILDKVHGEN